MLRVLKFFIESVFWLQIFLCPFLAGGIIAFLLYSSQQDLWPVSIFFVLTGFVFGIILAERIRKKYGCSRYLSRILSTPDIWPVDDEPLDRSESEIKK
jgi:hypothetical protein